MFDGANRRVVSLWFPRLASDRALRAHPASGPFVLTIRQDNTNRIYCLNAAAGQQGLHCGMVFADARAFCTGLQSRPADLLADQRFLAGLRRWATRYCPWVGFEENGLVMDVTGSAHLFGGEPALLGILRQRLTRAGLGVQIGLADTRGAAWALAHHGGGIAPPGEALAVLGPLPVAALRLESATVTALQRLGLRSIMQLAGMPRAPLARRFGPGVLMRLDQALGEQPEQISPASDPPHYGVRISLPEPIGLEADVMAATSRLLDRLCVRLAEQGAGARALRLTLRRVDQHAGHIELQLARAMRDPARILPLFRRGVGEMDAGFGIDQVRLEATLTEPLPIEQLDHGGTAQADRIDDLITRIGTRIGIGNIRRFEPVESHLPERGFALVPAACSRPKPFRPPAHPRPLILFPPEPISPTGPQPPQRFRWRRMQLETLRATGPERIAPEWWRDDPDWRSGVRDYWRIETGQGRRLWLFYTPQTPGWFVQGEFA